MILSSQVYDTLLDITRKDVRGKGLSVDEYNNIAPLVNRSVFEDFYTKFESNIDSSDTLGAFKVFEYQINLTPNANATVAYGTLPGDYYHIIGQPRTISGSTVKTVGIVSAQEHTTRINDYLTQPNTTYPMCQIGGVNASDELQIRVYPSTITSVYVDYLKEPTTPYLDYYVDNTTLNYTYMATDTNVSVPAGSTYRDGTLGGGVAIASLTENWDYSESDMELIIAKFLTIMGITLSDEILVQAGSATEIKELSK